VPELVSRCYGDYVELLDDLERSGWLDGLPVVAPTPDLVARFVDASGMDEAAVVGELAVRDVVATVGDVAVCGVLAGCRPEYARAVVAAAQAFFAPPVNAHCTTATLAGAAHLVVLNGDVRRQLQVNCTDGCLGVGTRANATIGRALRLIIRNVCHSVPGEQDRGTFNSPLKIGFCFGEDEEGSTWAALHEERGVTDSSAATVYPTAWWSTFRRVPDCSAEAFLDDFASFVRCKPVQPDEFLGESRSIVFVIGPEHRALLADRGWSKADVRAYLHPLVTAPSDVDRIGAPPRSTHLAPLDARRHGMYPTGQPVFEVAIPRPENLLLVGAGGRGCDSSKVLYPHLGSAVTVGF
jgi:hypothetical protein